MLPHKEFCLCRFRTVFCPTSSCFSTTKKKTRENSAVLRCQKKKLQKLPSFHFNRSQTSLEYGTKIFLP